MAPITQIAGEPVRYTDNARWHFNNGFRRLWLQNGYRIVTHYNYRGEASRVVCAKFSNKQEFAAWSVRRPELDISPDSPAWKTCFATLA